MKIEVLENPDQELINFLDQKIDELNWENWEVKERLPLAVQIKNDSGLLVAGAAARSFGDWLLLDTLWVADELRGQNIGTQLLAKLENAGKDRGCTKCLLDTLNFQAMPFYKKHGYEVKWIQEGYPREGCKYFMVKEL
jgi:GNAT superfamily N-acetyltransferase